MIVASRMNWAALTPSRCASRSTSVQRASAKRTVVARIGMGGTVPPTSLPLPPWVNNATRTRSRRRKRYRHGYICARMTQRNDLRGDLRPARRGGASRGVRRPARRDARRGRRPGGLRARLARLGLRRAARAARPLPAAARPQPRARSLAPDPGGRAGPASPRGAGRLGARRLHAPEAALARATERRLARAAVRRLPDEQRQAIGLAYWGGLSAHEVAAVEGIPLGTAKSRVRLGLAKLSRDPELVAA